MELMETTAAALCRSKVARGTACDAGDGTCRGCKQETEDAYRFVTTTGCFACERQALPGLVWFGRPICGTCAPNALSADKLTHDVDGDLMAIEKAAIGKGGEAGGEYLDSIGQYDLSRLTAEQWSTFLAKILTGYADEMRLAVKQCPPF